MVSIIIKRYNTLLTMKNEITINLRALNARQINNIGKILDQSLNDVSDETNEASLEALQDLYFWYY